MKAYEKEKVAYDEKMEEYKKTHPSNKRDPDLPKKPLTAYMLFNQAKRAEIKSAHPGMRSLPDLQ